MTAIFHGDAQGVNETLGHTVNLAWVRADFQQRCKLIAPDPRYNVLRTHPTSKAYCHLAQHGVSGLMAKRVVHALEMVDIQIEERETLTGRPVSCDCLVQMLFEQCPIGQACQHIMRSLTREPRFELFATVHATYRGDIAVWLACGAIVGQAD
ncbi:Uncharacterised protein [Starkeya nomas]|uniref:Uncharacterized protein n=1 Tax=Starkeya nomas TaxID=2666134 RepID=A0A5S9NQD2_9HYPH|nr:Uncharacterised protein [Starkeya nomas]